MSKIKVYHIRSGSLLPRIESERALLEKAAAAAARPPPHRAWWLRALVLAALAGAALWPSHAHHADLRAPEVAPRSADACAAALGAGLPGGDAPGKVALLFLVHGPVAHEPVWRAWLGAAEGRLPVEAAAAACNLTAAERPAAAAACLPPPPPAGGGAAADPDADAATDFIGRQHLFSVHVHLSADVPDAALTPPWRARLASRRVATGWGDHRLVEAARALLWEAYRDPANTRFVLVSESDVPIYDPLTLWRQLTAEPRSRVNAWWHPDASATRWTWRFALSPARVRAADWRKSSQWFTLTRAHAGIALRDVAVFRAFEKHCVAGADRDVRRYRDCYSDEHYLATLLHMAGLEEETVPQAGLTGVTAADWSQRRAHPREYGAAEATPALFGERLRGARECPLRAGEAAAAQAAAAAGFVAAADVFGGGGGGGGGGGEGACAAWRAAGAAAAAAEPALPATCAMLARKFAAGAAEAVLAVFRDCEAGLGLLGPDACPPRPAGAAAPPGGAAAADRGAPGEARGPAAVPLLGEPRRR